MKKFNRMWAVVLSFVLLIQIVALPASAAPSSNREQIGDVLDLLTPIPDDEEALEPMTEEDAAADETDEIMIENRTSGSPTRIIGEVESLRAENAKHYRHEDGTYTVAMYAEPVHYKAANGKWSEIDNTLTLNNGKSSATKKATYTPAAASLDIRIPQEFALGQQLTITKNGYTVGFGVSNKNTAVLLDKTASVVAVDQLASNLTAASRAANNTEEPAGDALAENAPAGGEPVAEGLAAEESAGEELAEEKPLSKAEQIRKANSEIMEVKKLSSAVVYEGIFPGADLEYIVTPSKIKENIVVNQAQAKYTYKFDVSLGGLIAEPQKNGAIFLFDPADFTEVEDTDAPETATGNAAATGADSKADKPKILKRADDAKPLFVFQVPYMYDSAGADSKAVKMTLAEDGTLTLTADAAWINDESRVFPVFIDPSIDMTSNVFQDAYISTALKNQNYNNMVYNYAGKGLLGTRRTYLKFTLPTLPDGSVVAAAVLGLIQFTCDYYSAGKDMYLFDLTGKPSWSPSTVTWNDQPVSQNVNGPKNDGVKIADYAPVFSGIGGYAFNITGIVKNWYENSGTNNGFMLATSDESSNTQATLYGANCSTDNAWPILLLGYNTNIGLEDYWSYDTIDLGRSGTAYVNDHNGSLTYVHNDLAMSGNLLPISLGHVYNSNSSVYSSYYSGMNTGAKFHLNIQELLTGVSPSDTLYNKNYRYRHYDGDGTFHYYRQNSSGSITHEYDDKLVLTTSGNNRIITDSQGNKKYFNSNGQLFKIEDNNGNTQTYTFSGNKITQITDGAGRVAILSYNPYNQLVSITDPAGRSTSFTYASTSASANLTSITYPNGKTTSFLYTTNSHISRITADDNSYVTFSYVTTAGCGRRVSYAYQYDKAGTQVDYLKFEYTKNNGSEKASGFTIVTNKIGKKNMYHFDNIGRTISVRNQDNQSQYRMYYSDTEEKNKFNKTMAQSELQTISTNLLKHHSFENISLGGNVYWQYVPDTGGQLGYSSAFSKNGLRSMRMSDNSQNSWNHVLQEFVAVPGETYTLSADFYIPDPNGLQGSGGVVMGFTYFDTSGTWHHDLSQPIKSTHGWERHSFTFTYPSNAVSGNSNFAAFTQWSAAGEFYFDNVQLEKSGGERNYNLVENSNFSYGTGTNVVPWTMSGTQVGDGVIAGNKLQIKGANVSKQISQTVLVNAKKGDTLVIGGQAGGYYTMDINDTRKFGIIAEIYSTNSKREETLTLNFNHAIAQEPLTVAKYFTLKTDCYKVIYRFVYEKQLGNATFENAFIYVGSFGEHYDYDTKGQLKEVKNDEGGLTEYEYSGTKLTDIYQTISGLREKAADIEYYPGSYNVKKITNNLDAQIEYTYTPSGQVTSKTIRIPEGEEMVESTTYIQGGNYPDIFTDARGGQTQYTYDTLTGLLMQVVDPKGNVTVYTYDPLTDELISTSGNAAPSTSVTTSFGMQDGLPKTITRNGMSYSYDYDNQNRVTATKVGSQTIVSNAYDSRQRLSQQTYANGAIYTPVYDSRDCQIGEKWNGVQIAEYFYNENDRLSQAVDKTTGVTYKYDYAFFGLLNKITSSDGSQTVYDYDMSGNLSHLTFSKDNATIHKARYSTDKKGNPEDIILESLDDTVLHYSYDEISRLTEQSIGPLLTQIEYLAGATNGTTTTLVERYKNENSSEITLQDYTYTYDANGNITEIADAVSGVTTTYTYDGLNRLIGETSGGNTFVYNYDVGGNLTSVTKNSVTQNYTYGNSDWKDQMTAHAGNAISYDAMGNPTGFAGYTLTWDKGRQLTSFTGLGMNIFYTYDASGRRIQQIVNGTTINYTYSGNLLMRQSDGVNNMDFQYDASGKVVGFMYNDSSYYYLRNLLGDIVAITDVDGNVVGTYFYNAWGDTAYSGAIAAINPIRYRGYYQDPYTGWHYLNTRYYSYGWQRFLNADALFITGDSITGSNMYAYCNGNPVMYNDPSGMGPITDLWSGIKDFGADVFSWVFEKMFVGLMESSWMQKIGEFFGSIPDWTEENFGFSLNLKSPFNFFDMRYFPFGWAREDNPNMSAWNLILFCGIGLQFWPWEGGVLESILNPDFWENIENGAGAWHAQTGWFFQWQRMTGFNKLYDDFFKFGASCDKATFKFEHTSNAHGTRWYTLWAWKGDYWQLGVGAEIGLYHATSENDFHWRVVASDEYLTVEKTIFHMGAPIYGPKTPPSNWWVCTFLPAEQGKLVADIGLLATITLPQSLGASGTMYGSFASKFNDANLYPYFSQWNGQSFKLSWDAGLKIGEEN